MEFAGVKCMGSFWVHLGRWVEGMVRRRDSKGKRGAGAW